MIPFQIKICGITTPEDASDAVDCGADAIGLNFYQKSPRFVTAAAATKIVDSLSRKNDAQRAAISADDFQAVKSIGVFVNSSVRQIIQTAVAFDLDGIQLHGDENPSIVVEIRRQLNDLNFQCGLIRAIRARPAGPAHEESGNGLSDVVATVAAWGDAGIDAVLLDAAVPGEFGGTGKVLDWEAVKRLSCTAPLALAGGLNPHNVEKAIDVTGVKAVDVASGVESSPGRKDRQKVSAFIQSARRAFDR